MGSKWKVFCLTGYLKISISQRFAPGEQKKEKQIWPSRTTTTQYLLTLITLLLLLLQSNKESRVNGNFLCKYNIGRWYHFTFLINWLYLKLLIKRFLGAHNTLIAIVNDKLLIITGTNTFNRVIFLQNGSTVVNKECNEIT